MAAERTHLAKCPKGIEGSECPGCTHRIRRDAWVARIPWLGRLQGFAVIHACSKECLDVEATRFLLGFSE